MHVVSDEYALAVVSNDAQDLTKNEIKVIYFSEFQGSQVPFNYGITVLKDVNIIGSELAVSINSNESDETPP